MATPRGRLVALAFVIAGCGPSVHSGTTDAGGNGDGPKLDGDGAPLPHTLSTISVDPANQIIQLDLNATGTQDYKVTAGYLDGTSEDITAQAQWQVMNPAVGSMNGATLDIPAFAQAGAQTSLLTASYNGINGLAQVTVVAYRQTGASQDFFFILPYTDPNGPVDKPLEFSTNVPSLDVFFDMDTTGSMSGEIKNLQSALNTTVVPQVKAAVADSQFGVGAMEDFPVGTFGWTAGACPGGDGTADQPFKLRQTITSDTTAVQNAVNGLTLSNGTPIGCGYDTPEGGLESIYQIASGNGISGPGQSNVPVNHTGVGGVAFRQGTMPIVVAISDADSHGAGETGSCSGQAENYGSAVPTAHSRQQTKDALAGICARVVGIDAIVTTDATCEPTGYMTDLATTTGARVPPTAWDVGTRPTGCAAGQCCTGQNGVGETPDGNGLCPLVFKVTSSGTGVGSNIATGISLLARFASFDVPTDTQGVTSDVDGVALMAPHTTADFIKKITPVSFVKPPAPPVLPDPTFDMTTFHGVTPGTKVDFTVDAFNDFVPQTNNAQIFKATIRVLAGGCTPLDARTVLILVPPTNLVIQ